MSILFRGATLHDRISPIYYTPQDASARRRALMSKEAPPVKDEEDSWPWILKLMEYLYISSWILSWLAAFSAMENARKASEGLHPSNFHELDLLTPLFIACQKASRWPQKVFEVAETVRVHGKGHPRVRKRMAYLVSTTIKFVLWSMAAIYTDKYVWILYIFFGITFVGTVMTLRLTEDESNWPHFKNAVQAEMRATTEGLVKLAAKELRW